MDIYWIKDKKKCGPATVPDVVSLLQMGELTPDTKGWHTGVQGWKPLRELPALADFIAKPEATPQTEPVTMPQEGPKPHIPTPENPFPERKPAGDERQQAERKAIEAILAEIHFPDDVKEKADAISSPTPGVRFLARLLDTAIYMTVCMAAFYMSGAPYDSLLSPIGNHPLLFWLPMLLVESFLLSNSGTTPGKWLTGIRVCTIGPEKKMSFGRALRRTIFVFILGMGMMLSILTVIMMLISYRVLRNRGICWWDMRALTIPVSVRPITAPRVVSLSIAIYFLMMLSGFFMQPWLKPFYEQLSQEAPEAAKILEPLLQQVDDPQSGASQEESSGSKDTDRQ